MGEGTGANSSRWDPDGAAGARWPFGRDATAPAPSPSEGASLPKGGRGCWDLPAHLDAGSLTTGLVKEAQVSTERVAALPGVLVPGCGEEGMLLPRMSLVPLHPHRPFFLWFLSFVLPAVTEQGAGDVISYL